MVLVAAAASAVVLAVPGGFRIFDGVATPYGAGRWVLLALLAAGGLMLRRGGPVATGVAATAGLFAAGQLSATGIWAVKHWRPFSGMVGTGYGMLPLLMSLAAVLAVAGALAAVFCLTAMRRNGVWAVQTTGTQRWVAFAAGVVVVVGLPVAMLGGLSPITMLGTFTLLFGLPWGIALAATGWLRRDAAIAAGGLVTVSALTAVGWSIGHSTEWRSVFLHLLAVAVVAALATALRLRRPTQAL
ncbi:hypothetical protein ACFXA2_00225 [Micromonospora chalcea]|uniref:hypothetical protein n=1 Tax=Micromonospora TaxID=1873 RepID=UPI0012601854|nr:hypothetical protein [Micromonospora sp. B006]